MFCHLILYNVLLDEGKLCCVRFRGYRPLRLPAILTYSTTITTLQTELCRSFEEFGTCRYGSKCQFAHSLDELRPVQRHPKYKTEVCRTFATTGTCPYGTRCRFIHQSATLAQLRTMKAGGSVSSSENLAAVPTNTKHVESNGQHMSARLESGIGIDTNPASFANVARGVAKVNRSATGHSARGIIPESNNNNHQMNGSASNSFVAGVTLGMSPTSKLPDYVTVASGGAKDSFQNNIPKQNTSEKHVRAEYETALTAAMDVLHCQDDPLFPEHQEDSSIHSQRFMGADTVLNHFSVGSFPGDSHMPADSMLNLDSNLMIGTTSRPGGESPIAGGSLPTSPHMMGNVGNHQTQLSSSLTTSSSSMMSNVGGQRERRLPVFSNLHTDK